MIYVLVIVRGGYSAFICEMYTKIYILDTTGVGVYIMGVKKESRIGLLIFKLLFFCAFIFSLGLSIYLGESAKNASKNTESDIVYIEKWTVTDGAGESFETGRTYMDKRLYSEDFTLISQLPAVIGHESKLCFMNRSDVSVYINGELRKKFDRIKDAAVPGGAVKEFYITIPLTENDAGGEIKIVRGKTALNPTLVSETFVTDDDGLYAYLIGKYGLVFAISVILLVAAGLVTVLGIVMRFWYKQNINMIYAALGIFVVACWLLSVSQLTPYFTRVYYADGIMGFVFCMLMPFALMIYINAIQDNRYRKFYSFLYVISLINFVFWTAVHFMGIRNFENSLVEIDTVLGFIVISVFVTLCLDFKRGYVKEYIYTAMGFALFMIMCVFEIALLVFFDNIGGQIPMLIGLLFLLLLVGIQQIDDIEKERQLLQAEVNNKILENEQMLIHIVSTLAGTIDVKDTYTNGHSGRVAQYSKEIARRFGYDEDKLNEIYMMALLHDIGKIGIPDAIINKPDKLTKEEYNTIKKHPETGENILKNIEEKPVLAMGARWHHERCGGGGYPDGLVGEQIPEQARIIAVADAYDAMTSFRSYRDPMPQEMVVEEIKKGKGTQFDPVFADIMLQMIEEDRKYKMREKRSMIRYKVF